MKLNTMLIVLGLSITPALPALANSTDPSGVWLRDDGNARVRIAPCGSNICATNVWIKDTSGGEEVGDRLVLTLKPEGADSLKGEAFDPKRNRRFAMTLTVKPDGLSTRGCIIGVLCKTVNWTPAQ
ncbi:MAG TPA: DUF2147 domain-containing protein [Bosea sp. (in: a-proteobacteria)]|jgi:uncharacterized protein (DUF2147 family)|uniref:DUF2147 domain-containing protein n=1 Tax=Bosea sp. (in: a-proteobacteria) TaxID=1871050 RepID=UPI002DDD8756|nr:DUF2147 domain-containing protein [Bosea sp. (in: a-proteobacteria)]HEV2552169.1 DUF2147 domain-containing protein [Bosea sp. (in: a-proteobacteria)]